MRSLIAIVCIFTLFRSPAQQLIIQPEPGWIQDFQLSNTTADTTSASDGYYYMMINRQQHVELKHTYRKYVTRVLSEKGLSAASSIQESFDPAYQRMVFHKLVIHRNGRSINKLDKNKFEFLRREEGLERAVYDKTLSAVCNLADVRIGDIIEYSFTLEGSNPIFKNHFFNTLYFNYSVPVGKIVNRIVYHEKRILHRKYYNSEIVPVEKTEGGLKHLLWEIENVAPLLTDDRIPSWYDPYHRVQITDFNSWDEVKSWAVKLFDNREKNSTEINDFINRLNENNRTAEEKALACINFVQREIRYLSFSDGIHGYKPHAPNQVASQKFGDCKDKSFLLTHLLNQVGIESYPALVSTDDGHTLPEILPHPWAFNHCIVKLHLNDSVYWIDPTLNPQVGKLKNFFFPDFKHALVVDHKPAGIEPIPFGFHESRVDATEEYIVSANISSPVILKVKTEYHGDEADEMRSYKASTSQEEINKSYVNFYANDFSEIQTRKDVTFIDNTEDNSITCIEEYSIDNFWTYDTDKRQNTSATYARILSSCLSKPSTKIRKMPLRITHPIKIFQTIKIILPEGWDMEDQTSHFESDGFSYHSSIRNFGNTLTLRYSYASKTDFIEPASVKHHLEEIDRVYNDLSFGFSYGSSTKTASSSDYSLVVLAIIGGLVLFFVLKKTYWRS